MTPPAAPATGHRSWRNGESELTGHEMPVGAERAKAHHVVARCEGGQRLPDVGLRFGRGGELERLITTPREREDGELRGLREGELEQRRRRGEPAAGSRGARDEMRVRERGAADQ